jgi:hypothetical protein
MSRVGIVDFKKIKAILNHLTKPMLLDFQTQIISSE